MRALLVAACALACGGRPSAVDLRPSPSPEPDSPAGLSPLAADAVAGVTDPALRAVIADHWEYTMRWSPVWATTLGDHRFDDRLAPDDPASIARAHAERAALIARLAALDPGALGEADRVTLALLRGELEAGRAMEVCRFQEWNKVGQLEILALRAESEAALGARFELPAFHAAVLGAGGITLPVLRDRVRAWIAKAAR